MKRTRKLESWKCRPRNSPKKPGAGGSPQSIYIEKRASRGDFCQGNYQHCRFPMMGLARWTNSNSCLLRKPAMELTHDFRSLTVPHMRLSRRSGECRTGCFSRSVCCQWARTSNMNHALLTTGCRFSGRKWSAEKAWREFFSDPSQWWDHRSEKTNRNYPDFKHKKTQQSLWLTSNLTPPWVKEELTAIAPGTLQLNIFSWNKLLRRYVKARDYKNTIDLFGQMHREGVIPNKFTFIAVLNACSGLLALDEGRRIHLQIMKSGLECDLFLGSCLIDMYGKCGRIEDARRVFNKLPTRDVVSYNALILGYAKCGQGQDALEIFRVMQREGVDLSSVTFVGVLNACASIKALEEGRCAHQQIISRGYEHDPHVASSLVDMYAKCGSLEDARNMFIKMPSRNAVSWNALIRGYVKSGQGEEALELSRLMTRLGVEFSPVTFVGILNACASIRALEEGRRAHEQVIDRGYESNAYVANSLVDMYAKCGSIADARRVFNKMPTRGVVSYNALIMGYVKCGEGREALKLYRLMQQEGIDMNTVSFVGVLNACANVGALEDGRHAHKQVIDRGYDCDVHVANSLVDMYAKCGSIADSRRVFNKMPTRDVVSWNTLILGHVKCGQGKEALELSQQMQLEGFDLDPITFVGVLNACASIEALQEGRNAHKQIIDKGYEWDLHVAHSLVDMYAKCGSIEDAQRVFNQMATRDVVSWTSMLTGFCRYGYTKEALGHFEQMCQEVEVDTVSFLSLLSACSHGGLVNEGIGYFESMTEVFDISPTLEHYSCVIDLLGRAGRLHEAEDLIMTMPCEPDAPVWKSLLGACRIHGNVQMGERVAKQALGLDFGNAASYVQLSNIFAAACRWDKVEAVQWGTLDGM